MGIDIKRESDLNPEINAVDQLFAVAPRFKERFMCNDGFEPNVLLALGNIARWGSIINIGDPKIAHRGMRNDRTFGDMIVDSNFVTSLEDKVTVLARHSQDDGSVEIASQLDTSLFEELNRLLGYQNTVLGLWGLRVTDQEASAISLWNGYDLEAGISRVPWFFRLALFEKDEARELLGGIGGSYRNKTRDNKVTDIKPSFGPRMLDFKLFSELYDKIKSDEPGERQFTEQNTAEVLADIRLEIGVMQNTEEDFWALDTDTSQLSGEINEPVIIDYDYDLVGGRLDGEELTLMSTEYISYLRSINGLPDASFSMGPISFDLSTGLSVELFKTGKSGYLIQTIESIVPGYSWVQADKFVTEEKCTLLEDAIEHVGGQYKQIIVHEV